WPGRLDAAVSLHPERLASWLQARAARGYPAPDRVFVAGPSRAVLRAELTASTFDGQVLSASSGGFAAKVALVDLGFDRAVLCGIPVDRGAHFFNTKPWAAADRHRKGWIEAFPAIGKRLRSMSGWTKEVFGEPSPEW